MNIYETVALNEGDEAWRASYLLAVFPEEDYARLVPHLELVKLAQNEILYNSGDRINYLYFPVDSIVSLLYTTENGATAEIAMIGNFGVVGYAAFLNGESALHQAVVQIAGDAYRISAEIVQQEFARGGAMQRILLHYMQALVTQISQVSVCNRLHTVEHRVSRWLLFCHDRLKSDEMVLTQEMLAQLLAVRRESVTVVAGQLQDAGMISYVRGHIHILDRRKLEQATCECYELVKKENERLVALYYSYLRRV